MPTTAGPPATSFDALRSVPATSAVDDAQTRVGADTIAKILFTSGSTGAPKGVINTQRMLAANQEQIRTVMAFLADAPPVLCDWLPWNHTFGGNHNFGLTLYNGGTLYLDAARRLRLHSARPSPTCARSRTTAYFNVPRGYELLVPALRADAGFRRLFFSRLQMLFYAAAGLRQEVADEMEELAVETLRRAHPVGHRPWVDRKRAVRDVHRADGRAHHGPHRRAGSRRRVEGRARRRHARGAGSGPMSRRATGAIPSSRAPRSTQTGST